MPLSGICFLLAALFSFYLQFADRRSYSVKISAKSCCRYYIYVTARFLSDAVEEKNRLSSVHA